MVYKLDGKCMSECPLDYESKDLYGDTNICSLIISKPNCSDLNICKNEGTCSIEIGSQVCNCKDGFYGQKCEYDQIALQNIKISLNTNMNSINEIDPRVVLSDENLIEIYTIGNLIKSIPELATKQLNDSITNIMYRQIQSIIDKNIPFQNYTFYLADLSLGIKNAM